MQNELKHHGVLGMKWGVRRYQNKDGSLTPKGKRRYSKVSTSEYLKWRDKKAAMKAAKNSYKQNSSMANAYKKSSDAYYKKADKQVYISEAKQAKGDQDGFKKHQSEAWKYLAKSHINDEKAKSFIDRANLDKKLYDDISSEKIKAGEDYIVQRDYYATPLTFGRIDTIIPRRNTAKQYSI